LDAILNQSIAGFNGSIEDVPLVISLILSSNRKDDTLECIDSLKMNDYDAHKIILLDNQSTDGTVDAVLAVQPAVQIIELVENRGYAGNNNVGIKIALEQGADWILIANDDTDFAPDCLAKMVEVGNSDATIGILGPMVYHHDEPNMIQSAGGVLGRNWLGMHLGRNEVDHSQFSEPHPVEWLSGCAILVRRDVIDQIGMLDERFFMYSEEKEWCMRASKAGWKLVNVPGAKVWHKGVQRYYQPKPYVTYYMTRNHLLLLAKHRAPLQVWWIAFVHYFRTIMSWGLKPKWRDKREHMFAMLHGITDFIFHRWGRMRDQPH
jgi:GT2 family glycosyltransferase